MPLDTPEIGIALLAGGEATRLPGKLWLRAGDRPMLARVFANVRGSRSIFVSCKAMLPPEIDEYIDAPLVIDAYDRRGPLGGLVTTMRAMTTPLVFAVAGDAPFIDATFVDQLAAAWTPGIEAVVPVHYDGDRERMEPLAALYDRAAFVREGAAVLHDGEGALRRVIERLRTHKVVARDPRIFTNVNTPAEYAALLEQLAP